MFALEAKQIGFLGLGFERKINCALEYGSDLKMYLNIENSIPGRLNDLFNTFHPTIRVNMN